MNVDQMFVVKIAAVVSFTIHPFVSVCLNTKEIHQVCHVNHPKMLAQYQLVDQTHNALVSPTELPSAHVYQVLSKVQIQFVDASNREVHVNHSHADWELHVMLHEHQFAIAQKEQLAIHSNNVAHQLLFENCANQVHVEVSFF